MRSFTPLFLLAIVILTGIAARALGGGVAAPVVAFCFGLPLLVIFAGGGRGRVNPVVVVLMLALIVAGTIAATVALWTAGPVATFLLVVVLATLAGFAWHRERIWRMRTESDHCPRCGYDVRATPDRCPECGEPSPSDIARRHRLREEIAAARSARESGFSHPAADNSANSGDSVIDFPPENL